MASLADVQMQVKTIDMSLRDWFAGQALNALLPVCPDTPFSVLALEAYLVAEAMIKTREGE